MDKVQKHNSFDTNTPSSESYRNYLNWSWPTSRSYPVINTGERRKYVKNAEDIRYSVRELGLSGTNQIFTDG
jgi:hypothetical protein